MCTRIIGSIFYKLAGLLLPIIYMIMVSNNLIAGQVDSGSMAYVLSTSTKRSIVIFTQAVYLVGSLLAMFGLTTITGCVCLAFVSEDVKLTYGKLILLNVGAFLVLFALSGLCFFTSCWLDRSKRSMAIGGRYKRKPAPHFRRCRFLKRVLCQRGTAGVLPGIQAGQRAAAIFRRISSIYRLACRMSVSWAGPEISRSIVRSKV